MSHENDRPEQLCRSAPNVPDTNSAIRKAYPYPSLSRVHIFLHFLRKVHSSSLSSSQCLNSDHHILLEAQTLVFRPSFYLPLFVTRRSKDQTRWSFSCFRQEKRELGTLLMFRTLEVFYCRAFSLIYWNYDDYKFSKELLPTHDNFSFVHL